MAELLRCSMRAANELTKDARDDRKKANASIALALQARGLTQRQMADKLAVTQKTVSNWLTNFGTVPELVNEPTLPDAETLDRIAQAIKDDAKGEVRPAGTC